MQCSLREVRSKLVLEQSSIDRSWIQLKQTPNVLFVQKKKPSTRSLTWRRAPTKLKQDTVKHGVPSASSRIWEKKIFSPFKRGWYIGLQGADNDCPSTCKRSKNGRRVLKLSHVKFRFHQKNMRRRISSDLIGKTLLLLRNHVRVVLFFAMSSLSQWEYRQSNVVYSRLQYPQTNK